MQAERINFLLEQIELDPQDPFNIYALAIEYKDNQQDKAIGYFEKLLQKFPEYLPTYYHAAALYFEKNQNSEAENTYLLGIKLAEKLNKEKALRELKSAYQMFLDEIDE
jgi:tetratricopeptide (TPR) repeat protein